MYMEHTQLKTIPLNLSPKIEIATLLTECLKIVYDNCYENLEVNKNTISLTESTALS